MRGKLILAILGMVLIAVFLTALFVSQYVTLPGIRTTSREPIKIALNVWPGYAHAFIAQEKGFFEKNNVEVELILKEEYSKAQELYINGEVDGIFEVYTDTIFHNSEGILTKLVYVSDHSDAGDVIIGKPEFNSLADLKGKKISVEGVNSFSHLFVLSVLGKNGLKEGDIFIENIPAHDVLTALEEGRIDAGHTWEPTKSAAIKKGYKILGKAGDIPGIITDDLAFNSKIIKERFDEIQAIVRSLAEASDYLKNNWDEGLQIMADAEGMGKEEMEEGVNGVHLQDLNGNIKAFTKSEETTSLYGSGKIIAEFYLGRGQMSSVPDFDEIIEARFINELINE